MYLKQRLASGTRRCYNRRPEGQQTVRSLLVNGIRHPTKRKLLCKLRRVWVWTESIRLELGRY
ncbi:Bgt-20923 [Blumeria graminis f. sp. tritici]|uniref:Bgt-20923 n=2 Tax=Blumeria graminis f. sp. tritici TaxID=62690 RepID=A0A381L9Q7_BLUGR|nr:Bgt-20923 [Blumeria graminis f. sp. tritici]